MLETLANLGEFIGGFAVVVTVIYLAVQINKTNDSIKTSAEFAAQLALQNVHSLSASTPAIANAIQARLHKDAADVDTEYLQYEQWFFTYLLTIQIQFTQHQRGVIDHAQLSTAAFLFQRVFVFLPQTRDIWEMIRIGFPDDFAAWVDGLIKEDNEQMIYFKKLRSDIVAPRKE